MKKHSVLSVLVVLMFISFSGIAMAYDSLFNYTGNTLPAEDGWRIRNYPSYEAQSTDIENGKLHITDSSTSGSTKISYQREWQVRSEKLNVAEFDIKVISGSAIRDIDYGIFVGTSDGSHNMAGLLTKGTLG